MFNSEDLLTFIEDDEFHDEWEDLGLNDDDLAILQLLIMLDPKGAPVVKGTGGLRKLRFAPPKWKKGKSGALRICYVYFEEVSLVLLLMVYAKGEKDDLSPADTKAIRELIRWEEERLSGEQDQ